MIRTIAPQYFTFNALRALCYATLVRFAYRPDDTNGLEWRNTFGTGNYSTFNGPGGIPPKFSITQIDNGPIILAFAGTESWTEFFDQVVGSLLVPWETGKGYVSGFFKDRFNAIRTIIEPALSELPSSDIYITGHSLGGAIAQLFASHFQTSLPNQVKGVITFSSPRVGNTDFVRSCRYPHIRVNHQGDIIPHLPYARGLEFMELNNLEALPEVYETHGTGVLVNTDGSLPDYDDPADSLTTAARSLLARRGAEHETLRAHDLHTAMHALAYHVDVGADWEVAWRMGILIDDLNRAEGYDWRMASIYPDFFHPNRSSPLIGQEVDAPLDITNPPARHQRHWSPSGRH